MHAKHEMYQLITQQARSFKSQLTDTTSWHKRLQKKKQIVRSKENASKQMLSTKPQ